MDILILSATLPEIKPLLTACGAEAESLSKFSAFSFAGNNIDVLITGVGMVHTSFYLGLTLQQMQYDFAINAGICGSFNRELQIGEVVNVTSDYFPEIGAEDEEGIKSVFDLNFQIADEFPYSSGKLVNESDYPGQVIRNIRRVSGVTLNTTHGEAASIERFVKNHKVDIESMEGAAFLFGCINTGISCLELRAVSNYIEPRDLANWDIPLAVRNLNDTLLKILKDISSPDKDYPD